MPAIFVHLSDIHFGQERDDRVHIHGDVKQQLIVDARDVISKIAGGSADGILVTGDIAQSGQWSEYEEAARWLDELASNIGVGIHCVQMVPGIKEGTGKGVAADIASRNMVIFENAPVSARLRIVAAVDEIAYVLKDRRVMDLSEEANNACAQLMFDAEMSVTSRRALVDAANTLIPILLNARRQPVSLIIAALFPIVYKELEKSVDVPESVNIFFYFLDWDRCKTARNDLVHAFMTSSWRPGHLALTACRCGEVSRMIKKVARSYEGEDYLIQIRNDLEELDDDNRRIVKAKIAELLQ